MSNYRNSALRLVRKVGPLPTLTRKQPGYPRDKTPGQHGKDLKSKKFLRDKSAYGLRLWEKQKLRFNYNITERQLVRYVRRAKRSGNATGDTLLGLLEMRLDNIVFRLGMSRTIVGARQLVSHGHITVNGRKITIPSYSCARKDQISIRDNPRSRQLVQKVVRPKSRRRERSFVPQHLSFNPDTCTGVVEQWASRRAVRLKINPLLVVEFYSGR